MARQGSQYAAINAGNDAVAKLVEGRLGLTVAPVVVARHVDKVLGRRATPAPAEEAVLLSDLAPATPHWWMVTLAKDHSLVSAGVADPNDVRQSIGFARSMAAYILLNDLLGGDETVPRAGCRAIFEAWFAPFPGVLTRVDAAISASPPDDPDFDSRVSSAWKALIAAGATKDDAATLTAETVERIGSNPAIHIVYRDAGLPGDGFGQIDVVRIGGPSHTDVIVLERGGDISFGLRPLCLVGDNRCSKYYEWP